MGLIRNDSISKYQPIWVATHLTMHLLALFGLFYFSWNNFIYMLTAHYIIMLFGITLGYHRYFAHKSYSAPKWLEFILGTIGALAFQGGPIFWASVHRAHHAFSDDNGDAHSAKKGFLWSHQKWMLFREPNGFSIIANRHRINDLTSSNTVRFIEKYFLYINLVASFLMAMVLPLSVWLWIFPVRIVFAWHITWSVNSFAHNQLPFLKRESLPKNILILSLLTCGEGLHKNHHIKPRNPCFEIDRFDFDIGYIFLRFLSLLRIIKIA